MQDETRWLFAVEPELSTAIARWPVNPEIPAGDLAALRAALEAMVGPAYVICDTATHPDWEGDVRALPDGAWPSAPRRQRLSLFRRSRPA